ncbi:hypothetical protein BH23BAC2_BH23BAC2_27480 [soil metagenome]
MSFFPSKLLKMENFLFMLIVRQENKKHEKMIWRRIELGSYELIFTFILLRLAESR